MLIPHKFTYLLAQIPFAILWALIFIDRKKLRTEMLFVGALFLIIGPVSNYLMWLVDWWNPPMTTKPPFSIEDALLGFTNAGIATVAYEFLFNKNYTREVSIKYKLFNRHFFYRLLVLSIAPFMTFILFYVLGLHSFIAVSSGLIVGGALVLYSRRDLIADALLSGLLMVIFSLPSFWLAEIITPGYIMKYWRMENLSQILVLGAPLEDLVWYFLMGLWIGGAYQYLFNYKIKE